MPRRLAALSALVGLFCLVLPAAMALAAPPASEAEILDRDRYKSSTWGYLVADMETGRVLAQQNPAKCFSPASTTKLFTAFCALEAFGPTHRLTTKVVRSGLVDKNGTLEGDLILVASGDLTLNGRTLPDGTVAFKDVDHTSAFMGGAELTEPDPLTGLNDLARQVAAAGIRKVEGRVLVDDRLFPTVPSGEKRHVITPMVINDNLIDLVITPGKPGAPAKVDWRPKSETFAVQAAVTTGPQGSGVELDTDMSDPGRLVVRGSVPPGKPVVWVQQVSDPAGWARVLFTEALARAGVRAAPLSTDMADLPAAQQVAGLPVVAGLESPPLAETVKLILKTSHNLGADLLPCLLAASRGKSGMDDGLALEGEMLRALGLDTSGISLGDGEGGVVADKLSPATVVAMLRLAASRPWFPAYRRALPILGVDGTLAHASGPNDPARGQVRAKTGTTATGDSLNWRLWLVAKGLAGYIHTASGRDLVFAVYVNNVPIRDFKELGEVSRDLGALPGLWYRKY